MTNTTALPKLPASAALIGISTDGRAIAVAPAQRRERNARAWHDQQRYEEGVTVYNEAVDHVNRERGRACNAAKVRAQTCMECFQMPAANGECGC